MTNDKLIELPGHGRLIVVTDLHGNFDDYNHYLNLWDESDEDFHIIFTGDMIHGLDVKKDQSVEILDDAIAKSKEFSNFHTLLGNHEWAQITSTEIYKNNQPLLLGFKNVISYKKGFIEPHLTRYIRFFKSMPYFAKTKNGLFISHSGPSTKVKSVDGFNTIFASDYSSPILYDFLWNRYNNVTDYIQSDVDRFLEIMDLKAMIVGHCPVESYKVFSKQIIMSSSFNTKVKTYLDMDLSMEITCIEDVQKQLKFIIG
ncbi:MAG: metallophosphoesterase [Methanobrevibacter sp.]|nr:metallophosphoesterase [Methanobrevibacter sp.]